MDPVQRIFSSFKLLRSLSPYIENTTYRLKNRSGINLTPPSDAVSENDGSKKTPKLNDSGISKKK